MKNLNSINIKGKTVFLRTEFNVALDKNFNVIDDTRLTAAIPTIEYLSNNGGKVIICSHLGRPWGTKDPSKSLRHLVSPLQKLLGNKKILFSEDCIGSERIKIQQKLCEGEILLLENVRYYIEENKNEINFSKKLAEGIDIYINDAFGNCHRPHASIIGVPNFVEEKAAGFLVEKEVNLINDFLNSSLHPAIGIVGGAKVAGKDGKIHVIKNLLNRFDEIIVVGKIAYYFLLAKGYNIGITLSSDERQIDDPNSDENIEMIINSCKEVLEMAKSLGKIITLPFDSLATLQNSPNTFLVDSTSKTDYGDFMAMDIGPLTINYIKEKLGTSKSLIWNGPAGYFEDARFKNGTLEIAKAVTDNKQLRTLLGGGDTLTALKEMGESHDNVYICTGGGAMLTMLMGKELIGVKALS